MIRHLTNDGIGRVLNGVLNAIAVIAPILLVSVLVWSLILTSRLATVEASNCDLRVSIVQNQRDGIQERIDDAKKFAMEHADSELAPIARDQVTRLEHRMALLPKRVKCIRGTVKIPPPPSVGGSTSP